MVSVSTKRVQDRKDESPFDGVFDSGLSLRASAQIISLVFTEEERESGIVAIYKFRPFRAEAIVMPCPNQEEAKRILADKNNGEAGWINDFLPPEHNLLGGPFAAAHLAPYYSLCAKIAGMSLEDYAERLRSDKCFLNNEREFLRHPYSAVLLNGSSAGMLSYHSFDDRYFRALKAQLLDMIQRKAAEGDFSLHLKSCGCGHHGMEAFDHLLMLQDTLRSAAEETLGADSNPAAVEEWCSRWNVSVTGYSISLEHLAEAEGKLPYFPFEENDCEMARLWKRYSTVKGEGEERYLELPVDLRSKINFEWIDLCSSPSNFCLAETPADVIVSYNCLYLYTIPCWSDEEYKEAFEQMVGALNEGGIFVTDDEINTTIHLGVGRKLNEGKVLPPSLYFSWPGLVEVPLHEPNLHGQCIPFELDDPHLQAGFFKRDENGRILIERYGDELRAHGGKCPSGIYVKES